MPTIRRDRGWQTGFALLICKRAGIGHAWLAATYAQLGKLAEARSAAAEVMRINPGYTIDGTQRKVSVFKRPEDVEHLLDGLRKAGLPG
jgi:adenylate cyclase